MLACQEIVDDKIDTPLKFNIDTDNYPKHDVIVLFMFIPRPIFAGWNLFVRCRFCLVGVGGSPISVSTNSVEVFVLPQPCWASARWPAAGRGRSRRCLAGRVEEKRWRCSQKINGFSSWTWKSLERRLGWWYLLMATRNPSVHTVEGKVVEI